MARPFNQEKLRRLVNSLVTESKRLADVDATFEPATLRTPATADELDALERHAGRALPPSLRALLSISNGAPNLCIFGDLFSTQDMLPGSAAHQRLTQLQSTLVGDTDHEEQPLIPPGVIPISDKRGDQPDCVYLDPRRIDASGEWQVVEFDHESDETRHRNLVGYLNDVLETMQLFVDEARRKSQAQDAKRQAVEKRPLILGPDGRPLNR